ncbi:MAG: hypothetical protein H6640_13670 [Caldilineaceae bacterium]|nr:hypothetical protein [Caldilineaceae bacterium]
MLDYLVEKSCNSSPKASRHFAADFILDRLCGRLCDAVLRDTSALGETLGISNKTIFSGPFGQRAAFIIAIIISLQICCASSFYQTANSAVVDQVKMSVAGYTRTRRMVRNNGLEIEAFRTRRQANVG